MQRDKEWETEREKKRQKDEEDLEENVLPKQATSKDWRRVKANYSNAKKKKMKMLKRYPSLT